MSLARLYDENLHMDTPTEPTTVPIGLSFFAGDCESVRRRVDRDHKNVVARHEYPFGHYAAHLTPDVLVADFHGFHSNLLADHTDI